MVLLWKDHKQKVGGGTETQRCTPKINPRASTRAGSSSSGIRGLLPARVHTRLCCLLLLHVLLNGGCAGDGRVLLHHASACGLKSDTMCQKQHPCLLPTGAAHALVPMQITAPAALSELFYFHWFSTLLLPAELLVICLQTEIRQLHAFSEQNKLLCYIQMQGILGATARQTMY